MCFTILEEIISSKEPDVNSYIAFFDLDRTITDAVSGNLLVASAYRKGFMSAADILYALWLLAEYKLFLRDPEKLIYKMTRWVRGIPEKTLEDLSEEISQKVLLPKVYPEALQEIKMHSANNARTVILSSSPVSVCRRMAGSLGIDDIVCSELESVDGYLTGRPVRQLCFGKEKANRLKEYCEKNNTSPEECWYYGDAFADFPALSIVGHPVCVNPDKKLLKKAKENGWKIYSWG
jgi:HAD superfamily hydrolase (TIGR01490 family)